MNIQTDREQMIFRKDYNGKTFYSIGLSKKVGNEYENGYMNCSFKKDVVLENQTKIKIKQAWISFYKNKDKATVPYVFINEFETVGAEKAETKVDNMSVFEEFGAEHQDLEDLLPF